MVSKNDYCAILERAVEELRQALTDRAEMDAAGERLDARIAELKQGVIALAPLCGVSAQSKYADLLPEYNVFFPVGLKEGVMAVLGAVKDDRYITPVTIRDNLESTGYEVKSKNILPSIHNVLKRLDGKEVESDDVNGRTGYRLLKKDRPRRAGPFDRLRRNALQEFAESLDKGETGDAFLNAVIKAGKTGKSE
jgi:hypothetical protein